MARTRGQSGRFVKEGVEEGSEPARRPAAVGAPRPQIYRMEAQIQMTRSIREIVRALVKEAKLGSVAHTRILAELTGWTKAEPATPRRRRRGKTFARALLEELGEGEAA